MFRHAQGKNFMFMCKKTMSRELVQESNTQNYCEQKNPKSSILKRKTSIYHKIWKVKLYPSFYRSLKNYVSYVDTKNLQNTPPPCYAL